MLQFSLTKKILIFSICLLGVLFSLPNGFYKRVEQARDAQAFLVGEAVPDPSLLSLPRADVEARAGGWPSFMPSTLVNLGLDLRGGAHLLAEVNVQEARKATMVSRWPDIRDALVRNASQDDRALVGNVDRQFLDDGSMIVILKNPNANGGVSRAVEIIRGTAGQVVSLQNVGASDLDVSANGNRVTVQFSEAEMLALDQRTMETSLEIVRRRVDEAGTREPTIQRQGTNRILIQVPGIGSAEDLKELIGKTAKLEFYPVIGNTSDPNAVPGPRQIILPDAVSDTAFYVLESLPVITGEHLVDAQPSFNQNNQPAVTFRLNPTGARIFGEYTANNIGSPFAIVLDSEVLSAPVIQDHIPGGSGIITGQFDLEETTKLAIQLRAGALPAKLTYLEERTVGPDLGADSIRKGALACIVAFIAVLVFMFLSYGTFGLFANVALILNVTLIFAILSLLGATLTLPGIAGIVLTIGMAVDANVLVFERIREELKTAKGPARAIELGYERAFSAIIDANITTFIAALILFIMGSGPVRGFSVTLGVGIVTSVFTAIWVTRLMISLWMEKRRPKTIEV